MTEAQQEAARCIASLLDDAVANASESKNLFINVYHEVLHQLLPLMSDVALLRKRSASHIDGDFSKILRRLDAGAQAATFSCENIVRFLSNGSGDGLYRSALAKPHFKKVSLSHLVAETVEQFRHLAEARRIELRGDLTTEEEVFIRGDVFHLKRLMYNILNNAIKYSYRSADGPGGPTLRHVDVEMVPRYSVEKREAAVLLQNYGVGVEPGEEQLLTRPGYRGIQARREGIRGCGVGLSQVADIARMHGGRLKIRSRPVADTTGAPSLFSIHVVFPTIAGP